MLKKSCYIFVFVLSFIKIDPVFSGEENKSGSSWLEESREEEPGTKSTATVAPKDRPPTPTKLKIKQTFKKRSRNGCCFRLRNKYRY